MRSYHLRSSLERSRPVVVRKDLKASAAAAMADSVSSVPHSGLVPISSPVEGSLTLKVLPDLAGRHSPLM